MDEKINAILHDFEKYIIEMVSAGFYSADEIVETASDVFADDADIEILRAHAETFTKRAITNQVEEQQSWPEVTDCDRLDRAFSELEAMGIMSRQNFSCCGTCGAGEIGDLIYDAIDAGETVRGYTFYHQQDTESAVEGYGICLNYGSVEEGENEALSIAREITSTLRKHDLNPEWDGTWNQRIVVPLDWKRRIRP